MNSTALASSHSPEPLAPRDLGPDTAFRDMNRLPSRVVALSFAALETGIAASITIAARAPLFMGAGHSSPEATAEALRMVAEKMEAAIEGAAAANVAMMSLWTRMMLGQIVSPASLPTGWRTSPTPRPSPSMRRVQANAKRLGKGRNGF